MARPCGCAGACGCTIVGTDGVRATGSGSVRDPITVGLASPLGTNGCETVMDCVGGSIGPGLVYNDGLNRLSAKVSADSGNSITYGADGGLFSTGGSGGGISGVTVASLPTTNLIGGSYGAGSTQHPEGPVKTYEAAMENDTTLIHVPVRRLSDFWLIAAHWRTFANYDSFITSGDTAATWDIKVWKRLVYRPSGPVQNNGAYFDPLLGYFGLGEPDGTGFIGGTLLADVFRIASRRKVLYLEVKDIGSSVGDTPAPDSTMAMLLGLLQQWGMTQSVIVGCEFPTTASQTDFNAILNGLKNLSSFGIAVAAHLASKAQMDAVPPASLTANGIPWVFLPTQAAMDNQAQATTYKTAGLQVMLHGAYRQVHFELQRTLGIRGALSTDPYYVQGWQNLFRYRKDTASWNTGSPDYGRHAYGGDSLTQHRSFDGYREVGGSTGVIAIRSDAIPPGDTASLMQSGYYILAGEQCPINDPTRNAGTPGAYGSPTNYDIEVGFSWAALVSDRGRWCGVWFCAPDDSAMLEYTRANANTRGYEIQLSQNGTFSFRRYDGIPYTGPYPPTTTAPDQYSTFWDSTWGTIVPGTEYRILIQVRPGTITVGRLGANSTVLNGRTFNATTGGGDRWRGPYFHFGRHFFTTSDATTCRFHNLLVRNYA